MIYQMPARVFTHPPKTVVLIKDLVFVFVLVAGVVLVFVIDFVYITLVPADLYFC